MATKTDNHYLADKVELRMRHIPPRDVRVLDCYGGHGKVWALVKEKTSIDINRTAIDQRDDLKTFHLHGDNVKVMAGMDLSKFNVIDLDAYGVPYEQLKVVFNSGYSGVVFVTFIQTMQGSMPHGMLRDIGISSVMVKKCPSMFGKHGWAYFKEWLSLRGVSEIYHRSKNRKHYFAFFVSGAVEPSRDSDTLLEGIFEDPF